MSDLHDNLSSESFAGLGIHSPFVQQRASVSFIPVRVRLVLEQLLAQHDTQDFITAIAGIRQWQWEVSADLAHWAPVVDRVCAILHSTLAQYPALLATHTLSASDSPIPEQVLEDACTCVRFLGLLFRHAVHKSVFKAYHLMSQFLDAVDDTLAETAVLTFRQLLALPSGSQTVESLEALQGDFDLPDIQARLTAIARWASPGLLADATGHDDWDTVFQAVLAGEATAGHAVAPSPLEAAVDHVSLWLQPHHAVYWQDAPCTAGLGVPELLRLAHQVWAQQHDGQPMPALQAREFAWCVRMGRSLLHDAAARRAAAFGLAFQSMVSLSVLCSGVGEAACTDFMIWLAVVSGHAAARILVLGLHNGPSGNEAGQRPGDIVTEEGLAAPTVHAMASSRLTDMALSPARHTFEQPSVPGCNAIWLTRNTFNAARGAGLYEGAQAWLVSALAFSNWAVACRALHLGQADWGCSGAAPGLSSSAAALPRAAALQLQFELNAESFGELALNMAVPMLAAVSAFGIAMAPLAVALAQQFQYKPDKYGHLGQELNMTIAPQLQAMTESPGYNTAAVMLDALNMCVQHRPAAGASVTLSAKATQALADPGRGMDPSCSLVSPHWSVAQADCPADPAVVTLLDGTFCSSPAQFGAHPSAFWFTSTASRLLLAWADLIIQVTDCARDLAWSEQALGPLLSLLEQLPEHRAEAKLQLAGVTLLERLLDCHSGNLAIFITLQGPQRVSMRLAIESTAYLTLASGEGPNSAQVPIRAAAAWEALRLPAGASVLAAQPPAAGVAGPALPSDTVPNVLLPGEDATQGASALKALPSTALPAMQPGLPDSLQVPKLAAQRAHQLVTVLPAAGAPTSQAVHESQVAATASGVLARQQLRVLPTLGSMRRMLATVLVDIIDYAFSPVAPTAQTPGAALLGSVAPASEANADAATAAAGDAAQAPPHFRKELLSRDSQATAFAHRHAHDSCLTTFLKDVFTFPCAFGADVFSKSACLLTDMVERDPGSASRAWQSGIAGLFCDVVMRGKLPACSEVLMDVPGTVERLLMSRASQSIAKAQFGHGVAARLLRGCLAHLYRPHSMSYFSLPLAWGATPHAARASPDAGARAPPPADARQLLATRTMSAWEAGVYALSMPALQERADLSNAGVARWYLHPLWDAEEYGVSLWPAPGARRVRQDCMCSVGLLDADDSSMTGDTTQLEEGWESSAQMLQGSSIPPVRNWPQPSSVREADWQALQRAWLAPLSARAANAVAPVLNSGIGVAGSLDSRFATLLRSDVNLEHEIAGTTTKFLSVLLSEARVALANAVHVCHVEVLAAQAAHQRAVQAGSSPALVLAAAQHAATTHARVCGSVSHVAASVASLFHVRRTSNRGPAANTRAHLFVGARDSDGRADAELPADVLPWARAVGWWPDDPKDCAHPVLAFQAMYALLSGMPMLQQHAPRALVAAYEEAGLAETARQASSLAPLLHRVRGALHSSALSAATALLASRALSDVVEASLHAAGGEAALSAVAQLTDTEDWRTSAAGAAGAATDSLVSAADTACAHRSWLQCVAGTGVERAMNAASDSFATWQHAALTTVVRCMRQCGFEQPGPILRLLVQGLHEALAVLQAALRTSSELAPGWTPASAGAGLPVLFKDVLVAAPVSAPARRTPGWAVSLRLDAEASSLQRVLAEPRLARATAVLGDVWASVRQMALCVRSISGIAEHAHRTLPAHQQHAPASGARRRWMYWGQAWAGRLALDLLKRGTLPKLAAACTALGFDGAMQEVRQYVYDVLPSVEAEALGATLLDPTSAPRVPAATASFMAGRSSPNSSQPRALNASTVAAALLAPHLGQSLAARDMAALADAAVLGPCALSASAHPLDSSASRALAPQLATMSDVLFLVVTDVRPVLQACAGMMSMATRQLVVYPRPQGSSPDAAQAAYGSRAAWPAVLTPWAAKILRDVARAMQLGSVYHNRADQTAAAAVRAVLAGVDPRWLRPQQRPCTAAELPRLFHLPGGPAASAAQLSAEQEADVASVCAVRQPVPPHVACAWYGAHDIEPPAADMFVQQLASPDARAPGVVQYVDQLTAATGALRDAPGCQTDAGAALSALLLAHWAGTLWLFKHVCVHAEQFGLKKHAEPLSLRGPTQLVSATRSACCDGMKAATAASQLAVPASHRVGSMEALLHTLLRSGTLDHLAVLCAEFARHSMSTQPAASKAQRSQAAASAKLVAKLRSTLKLTKLPRSVAPTRSAGDRACSAYGTLLHIVGRRAAMSASAVFLATVQALVDRAAYVMPAGAQASLHTKHDPLSNLRVSLLGQQMQAVRQQLALPSAASPPPGPLTAASTDTAATASPHQSPRQPPPDSSSHVNSRGSARNWPPIPPRSLSPLSREAERAVALNYGRLSRGRRPSHDADRFGGYPSGPLHSYRSLLGGYAGSSSVRQEQAWDCELWKGSEPIYSLEASLAAARVTFSAAMLPLLCHAGLSSLSADMAAVVCGVVAQGSSDAVWKSGDPHEARMPALVSQLGVPASWADVHMPGWTSPGAVQDWRLPSRHVWLGLDVAPKSEALAATRTVAVGVASLAAVVASGPGSVPVGADGRPPPAQLAETVLPGHDASGVAALLRRQVSLQYQPSTTLPARFLQHGALASQDAALASSIPLSPLELGVPMSHRQWRMNRPDALLADAHLTAGQAGPGERAHMGTRSQPSAMHASRLDVRAAMALAAAETALLTLGTEAAAHTHLLGNYASPTARSSAAGSRRQNVLALVLPKPAAVQDATELLHAVPNQRPSRFNAATWLPTVNCVQLDLMEELHSLALSDVLSCGIRTTSLARARAVSVAIMLCYPVAARAEARAMALKTNMRAVLPGCECAWDRSVLEMPWARFHAASGCIVPASVGKTLGDCSVGWTPDMPFIAPRGVATREASSSAAGTARGSVRHHVSHAASPTPMPAESMLMGFRRRAVTPHGMDRNSAASQARTLSDTSGRGLGPADGHGGPAAAAAGGGNGGSSSSSSVPRVDSDLWFLWAAGHPVQPLPGTQDEASADLVRRVHAMQTAMPPMVRDAIAAMRAWRDVLLGAIDPEKWATYLRGGLQEPVFGERFIECTPPGVTSAALARLASWAQESQAVRRQLHQAVSSLAQHAVALSLQPAPLHGSSASLVRAPLLHAVETLLPTAPDSATPASGRVFSLARIGMLVPSAAEYVAKELRSHVHSAVGTVLQCAGSSSVHQVQKLLRAGAHMHTHLAAVCALLTAGPVQALGPLVAPDFVEQVIAALLAWLSAAGSARWQRMRMGVLWPGVPTAALHFLYALQLPRLRKWPTLAEQAEGLPAWPTGSRMTVPAVCTVFMQRAEAAAALTPRLQASAMVAVYAALRSGALTQSGALIAVQLAAVLGCSSVHALGVWDALRVEQTLVKLPCSSASSALPQHLTHCLTALTRSDVAALHEMTASAVHSRGQFSKRAHARLHALQLERPLVSFVAEAVGSLRGQQDRNSPALLGQLWRRLMQSSTAWCGLTDAAKQWVDRVQPHARWPSSVAALHGYNAAARRLQRTVHVLLSRCMAEVQGMCSSVAERAVALQRAEPHGPMQRPSSTEPAPAALMEDGILLCSSASSAHWLQKRALLPNDLLSIALALTSSARSDPLFSARVVDASSPAFEPAWRVLGPAAEAVGAASTAQASSSAPDDMSLAALAGAVQHSAPLQRMAQVLADIQPAAFSVAGAQHTDAEQQQAASRTDTPAGRAGSKRRRAASASSTPTNGLGGAEAGSSADPLAEVLAVSKLALACVAGLGDSADRSVSPSAAALQQSVAGLQALAVLTGAVPDPSVLSALHGLTAWAIVMLATADFGLSTGVYRSPAPALQLTRMQLAARALVMWIKHVARHHAVAGASIVRAACAMLQACRSAVAGAAPPVPAELAHLFTPAGLPHITCATLAVLQSSLGAACKIPLWACGIVAQQQSVPAPAFSGLGIQYLRAWSNPAPGAEHASLATAEALEANLLGELVALMQHVQVTERPWEPVTRLLGEVLSSLLQRCMSARVEAGDLPDQGQEPASYGRGVLQMTQDIWAAVRAGITDNARLQAQLGRVATQLKSRKGSHSASDDAHRAQSLVWRAWCLRGAAHQPVLVVPGLGYVVSDSAGRPGTGTAGQSAQGRSPLLSGLFGASSALDPRRGPMGMAGLTRLDHDQLSPSSRTLESPALGELLPGLPAQYQDHGDVPDDRMYDQHGFTGFFGDMAGDDDDDDDGPLDGFGAGGDDFADLALDSPGGMDDSDSEEQDMVVLPNSDLIRAYNAISDEEDEDEDEHEDEEDDELDDRLDDEQDDGGSVGDMHDELGHGEDGMDESSDFDELPPFLDWGVAAEDAGEGMADWLEPDGVDDEDGLDEVDFDDGLAPGQSAFDVEIEMEEIDDDRSSASSSSSSDGSSSCSNDEDSASNDTESSSDHDGSRSGRQRGHEGPRRQSRSAQQPGWHGNGPRSTMQQGPTSRGLSPILHASSDFVLHNSDFGAVPRTDRGHLRMGGSPQPHSGSPFLAPQDDEGDAESDHLQHHFARHAASFLPELMRHAMGLFAGQGRNESMSGDDAGVDNLRAEILSRLAASRMGDVLRMSGQQQQLGSGSQSGAARSRPAASSRRARANSTGNRSDGAPHRSATLRVEVDSEGNVIRTQLRAGTGDDDDDDRGLAARAASETGVPASDLEYSGPLSGNTLRRPGSARAGASPMLAAVSGLDFDAPGLHSPPRMGAPARGRREQDGSLHRELAALHAGLWEPGSQHMPWLQPLEFRSAQPRGESAPPLPHQISLWQWLANAPQLQPYATLSVDAPEQHISDVTGPGLHEQLAPMRVHGVHLRSSMTVFSPEWPRVPVRVAARSAVLPRPPPGAAAALAVHVLRVNVPLGMSQLHGVHDVTQQLPQGTVQCVSATSAPDCLPGFVLVGADGHAAAPVAVMTQMQDSLLARSALTGVSLHGTTGSMYWSDTLMPYIVHLRRMKAERAASVLSSPPAGLAELAPLLPGASTEVRTVKHLSSAPRALGQLAALEWRKLGTSQHGSDSRADAVAPAAASAAQAAPPLVPKLKLDAPPTLHGQRSHAAEYDRGTQQRAASGAAASGSAGASAGPPGLPPPPPDIADAVALISELPPDLWPDAILNVGPAVVPYLPEAARETAYQLGLASQGMSMLGAASRMQSVVSDLPEPECTAPTHLRARRIIGAGFGARASARADSDTYCTARSQLLREIVQVDDAMDVLLTDAWEVRDSSLHHDPSLSVVSGARAAVRTRAHSLHATLPVLAPNSVPVGLEFGQRQDRSIGSGAAGDVVHLGDFSAHAMSHQLAQAHTLGGGVTHGITPAFYVSKTQSAVPVLAARWTGSTWQLVTTRHPGTRHFVPSVQACVPRLADAVITMVQRGPLVEFEPLVHLVRKLARVPQALQAVLRAVCDCLLQCSTASDATLGGMVTTYRMGCFLSGLLAEHPELPVQLLCSSPGEGRAVPALRAVLKALGMQSIARNAMLVRTLTDTAVTLAQPLATVLMGTAQLRATRLREWLHLSALRYILQAAAAHSVDPAVPLPQPLLSSLRAWLAQSAAAGIQIPPGLLAQVRWLARRAIAAQLLDVEDSDLRFGEDIGTGDIQFTPLTSGQARAARELHMRACRLLFNAQCVQEHGSCPKQPPHTGWWGQAGSVYTPRLGRDSLDVVISADGWPRFWWEPREGYPVSTSAGQFVYMQRGPWLRYILRHGSSHKSCALCAALPDTQGSYATRNLVGHLRVRHAESLLHQGFGSCISSKEVVELSNCAQLAVSAINRACSARAARPGLKRGRQQHVTLSPVVFVDAHGCAYPSIARLRELAGLDSAARQPPPYQVGTLPSNVPVSADELANIVQLLREPSALPPDAQQRLFTLCQLLSADPTLRAQLVSFLVGATADISAQCVEELRSSQRQHGHSLASASRLLVLLQLLRVLAPMDKPAVTLAIGLKPSSSVSPEAAAGTAAGDGADSDSSPMADVASAAAEREQPGAQPLLVDVPLCDIGNVAPQLPRTELSFDLARALPAAATPSLAQAEADGASAGTWLAQPGALVQNGVLMVHPEDLLAAVPDSHRASLDAATLAAVQTLAVEQQVAAQGSNVASGGIFSPLLAQPLSQLWKAVGEVTQSAEKAHAASSEAESEHAEPAAELAGQSGSAGGMPWHVASRYLVLVRAFFMAHPVLEVHGEVDDEDTSAAGVSAEDVVLPAHVAGDAAAVDGSERAPSGDASGVAAALRQQLPAASPELSALAGHAGVPELDLDQASTRSESGGYTPAFSSAHAAHRDSSMQGAGRWAARLAKQQAATRRTIARFADDNRAVINAILCKRPELLDAELAPLVRIPSCRAVLSFENKIKYFRKRIAAMPSASTSRPLHVEVARDRVLHDTLRALDGTSASDMRRPLSIKFRGEEGVDAGGVRREWFELLAREMFNPDLALFKPSGEGGTAFQPSPDSHVQEDHLKLFWLVGRVVGKALLDGQPFDAHFTRPMYKQMLGLPLTWHDLEPLDPQFYRSLRQIMDNSIDDMYLGLTFSVDEERMGDMTEVELCPGGAEKEVTDANKAEYIRLLTRHKLVDSIAAQMRQFLGGFHDAIPAELIQIFTDAELELLISGLPTIDVEDLKRNTEYNGYTPADPVIVAFWEVLGSFPEEDKARFLQFVTGTSKVPLGGFEALRGMRGATKFSIHRSHGSDDARLPQSHTCFNQLDLPPYSTAEVLKERLLTAIREGAEGFGFA